MSRHASALLNYGGNQTYNFTDALDQTFFSGTPADPLGFVNIDFADDGDSVTLMWTGTSWAVVAAVKVATDWGIIDIS